MLLNAIRLGIILGQGQYPQRSRVCRESERSSLAAGNSLPFYESPLRVKCVFAILGWPL